MRWNTAEKVRGGTETHKREKKRKKRTKQNEKSKKQTGGQSLALQ